MRALISQVVELGTRSRDNRVHYIRELHFAVEKSRRKGMADGKGYGEEVEKGGARDEEWWYN